MHNVPVVKLDLTLKKTIKVESIACHLKPAGVTSILSQARCIHLAVSILKFRSNRTNESSEH